MGLVGDSLSFGARDEDLISAAELGLALQGGWRPISESSPIPLFEGEYYAAGTGFRLDEYAGADVSYRGGSVAAFGSPLFLAASVGGSLPAKPGRKRRARAAAAPQWRSLEEGHLHVTTLRLAMQSTAGWHEIAHRDVRQLECMVEGIVVFVAGRAPLRLCVAWPAYLYVLLQYLIVGRVVVPSIDDDTRQRAAAHGRALPSGT